MSEVHEKLVGSWAQPDRRHVTRRARCLALSAEERIWDYTQGHWDNTTLFATYLDDELGAKRANQTHRIITPEIVEPVFERLMGISYEPGAWP